MKELRAKKYENIDSILKSRALKKTLLKELIL